MQAQLKNIRYSYHRNGVAGDGFYACLFDWHDGEGPTRHMQAIIFPSGDCQCAVLDVDETAKGNIGFAEGNSWRGDHFIDELKAHINRETKKRYLREGWVDKDWDANSEWEWYPKELTKLQARIEELEARLNN